MYDTPYRLNSTNQSTGTNNNEIYLKYNEPINGKEITWFGLSKSKGRFAILLSKRTDKLLNSIIARRQNRPPDPRKQTILSPHKQGINGNDDISTTINNKPASLPTRDESLFGREGDTVQGNSDKRSTLRRVRSSRLRKRTPRTTSNKRKQSASSRSLRRRRSSSSKKRRSVASGKSLDSAPPVDPRINLIEKYLSEKESPMKFIQDEHEEMNSCESGFNILLGDTKYGIYFYDNRDPDRVVFELMKGEYFFHNAKLGIESFSTCQPKFRKSLALFRDILSRDRRDSLESSVTIHRLLGLMKDRETFGHDELPDTVLEYVCNCTLQ